MGSGASRMALVTTGMTGINTYCHSKGNNKYRKACSLEKERERERMRERENERSNEEEMYVKGKTNMHIFIEREIYTYI